MILHLQFRRNSLRNNNFVNGYAGSRRSSSYVRANLHSPESSLTLFALATFKKNRRGSTRSEGMEKVRLNGTSCQLVYNGGLLFMTGPHLVNGSRDRFHDYYGVSSTNHDSRPW